MYEVTPRWTAAGRRNARRPGKSDALDAQAVARLVQREAATLPCVGADDESAVLAFLVAERDAVVAESTSLRNQLHQLLLQADPEYRAHLPTRRTPAGVAALAQYTPPSTPPPVHARWTRSGPPLCGASHSACGWRWSRPTLWRRRSGSVPKHASSP